MEKTIDWKIAHSIKEFLPEEWNSLERGSFPFQKYEFHLSLEDSRCIGEKTGWDPVFFYLRRDGELKAVAPFYVKYHSYGEFIFDWEIAQIYGQMNIAYYPKLLGAIPFSPVVGKKILYAVGEDQKKIIKGLIKAISDFSLEQKLSSYHCLFIDKEEVESMQESMSLRKTFQFHWENRNYSSFDEFLATLKKSKRKNIKKERKTIAEQPLEIRVKTDNFTKEDSSAMWSFYRSTIEKKLSQFYLNQEFFERLFELMAKNILLIQAYEKGSGELIAQSLFLWEGKHLYGRYWGIKSEKEHLYPFLHFELSYYRGIDFCIEHNIEIFEAGAQGGHKLLRGFDPEITYSAHHFFHPGLNTAIKDFYRKEADQIEAELLDPSLFSAYKKDI